MNFEQERAAFEWWASDEGESPRATERAGGCYKLSQIQSYWVAWQASRAALVVELPEVSRQVTWDDESIDVFWPNEVRIALESAGVRVKS